jgi:hypothetical protein
MKRTSLPLQRRAFISLLGGAAARTRARIARFVAVGTDHSMAGKENAPSRGRGQGWVVRPLGSTRFAAHLGRAYSLSQLRANACIAASRVGS